MEGYERAGRRRGADVGSGHREGRGGGGNWYDWGGLEGADMNETDAAAVPHKVVGWQERRVNKKQFL